MDSNLDLSLIQLNETLPNWSIEAIFGDQVPSKEDFIGKPLLVLFFSLGCPGCLGRAIPYANSIVYEKGMQVNVLGIHTNFEAIDFSKEQFENAKEKYFIRFPFYKDKDYDTTFLDFGAGGTPHWILTDVEGKVNYSIFGSDPNNALLRLDLKIQELLQQ